MANANKRVNAVLVGMAKLKSKRYPPPRVSIDFACFYYFLSSTQHTIPSLSLECFRLAAEMLAR